MKKFIRKLALVLAIVMAVGLVAPAGAQAATARWSWNFGANNATKEMSSNEYFKFQILDNGKPVDTTLYDVKFESSNENVLFIRQNGQARADKFGKLDKTESATLTATITNKNKGTKKVMKANIKVLIQEDADKVVISNAHLADEPLKVGSKFDFNSKMFDKNGNLVELEETGNYRGWFSSDPSIASIDIGNGVLKGLKPGQVTVTVATFKSRADRAIGLSKAIKKTSVTVTVVKELPSTTPTNTPSATPTPTTAPSVIDFVAEQKSMNTFTMTFNQDISKTFSKDKISVFYSTSANGALIKEYIKDADIDATGTVVTVTMYNNFVVNRFIHAKYADETSSFKVSKGSVAEVQILTQNVPFNEVTPIEIKLLDENGIDITTEAELANISLSHTGNSSSLSGSSIFFWEKNASAVVTATYHTYDYVTNGDGTELVIVSAPTEITSVEETVSLSQITAWTITDKSGADANWSNPVHYIPLGTTSHIIGKAVQTTTSTSSSSTVVYTDTMSGISYESSNSSILLVGSDGLLVPVALGSADIIIRQNEAILGVFTVTVSAAKTPTTINISADKHTLSNGENANDSITVSITVKDQYGNKMSATPDMPELLPATGSYGGQIDLAENKVVFRGVGASDGSYTFRINQFGLTAVVTFTVKTPGSTPSTYDLEASATSVDTKVTSSESGFNNKEINLTAYSYAGNGYKLSKVAITGEYTTVATGAGLYYRLTSAPSKHGANISLNEDGSLSFIPYTINEEDSTISKAAPGTYVFTLYEAKSNNAGGFVYVTRDTVAIQVKDTQDTVKVTVDKVTSTESYDNCINGSEFIQAGIQAAIEDCFTFRIGSSEIHGITNVKGQIASGSRTVYIKSVDYLQEFNFGDTVYYVKHTITINQAITLQ